MKSRMVPFLVLALLVCAGALVGQRHVYEQRFARQEQAIALVQAQADAARERSQLAKRADAKREAAHAALVSAKTVAPRYDALRNITGYEKKTAARR